MRHYGELDLLSASFIVIPDVCTIKPIFLSEFKGFGGASKYKEYRQELSLLSATTEDILESLESTGIVDEKIKDYLGSTSEFEILVSLFKEPFIKALSFFIEERIVWNQEILGLTCHGSDSSLFGTITKDTYPVVRRAIMESNYLIVEDSIEEMKFHNEKSRSIFEKLLKGRKKKKIAKSGNEPTLEDIISSVSVRSNGYTLFNIWDLSIYQLYDQFTRININYQLDVSGLKWAAWGSEPFDFSLWYQSNRN